MEYLETMTLYGALRWLLALPFAGLFLVATAFNYTVLFNGFAGREFSPSMGPLIGGLSGAVALIVCPIDGATDWWWVPLVVDPGSALYFGFAGVVMTGMWWRGELKTEPMCKPCQDRISRETYAAMEANGGKYPEDPECLPYLVDGVCPVCGAPKPPPFWRSWFAPTRDS